MSAMHCKTYRPAFLVEGELEQEFIRNVCPGAPVQKIGCNGDDVAIAAIAKRVGTLGRLLQKRYDPLIIVFDRERRHESAAQLEQMLIEALKIEGLTSAIFVGVPDRDIEVWILADCEIFRQCADIPTDKEVQPCEGYKGKAAIKQLLKGRKPYVESVDGPLWLKKSRAAHIAKRSRSFERFSISLKFLECWWLEQSSLI